MFDIFETRVEKFLIMLVFCLAAFMIVTVNYFLIIKGLEEGEYIYFSLPISLTLIIIVVFFLNRLDNKEFLNKEKEKDVR